MNTVTIEDVNYLAQQSSGHINMILSGMTTLMNDTDSRVTTMESQGWFIRMVKTVTGKNKLTQSEIQQNHDKLNVYMSEAIAELYNRNCIDHEIMMSLGTHLNELYADHLQLKKILGTLVSKLNEKIDSVDNFHMLITEIEQGVYAEYSPIFRISKVISQFDNRILEDNRKLDIIQRSLVANKIINRDEVLLTDYLMSIMEVPMGEIGQIYLELGTIRQNFMANIILKMIEKYHFVPDVERKMKNKRALIAEVVNQEGLDDSISLSIQEIYNDLVNSKIDVKNRLIPIVEAQGNLELEEAEKLYLECKFDEAFVLFMSLAEKGNSRAMYFIGEYYVGQLGHTARNFEEGLEWFRRGFELADFLSSLRYAYFLPEDCDERYDIFNTVFQQILGLAEKGDVFAQSELATLYIDGNGTEKDEIEGLNWLKRSAHAGFWRSINELGDAYYLGTLVEQDYHKAIKYYKKGIEKGSAESVFNLAYCYYEGEGIDEDNAKAKELFQKSYILGNGEAAHMIGVMYSEGYGVSKDTYKEYYWMKKSAETGCVTGQSSLADCYYSGCGTTKDITKAKEWYLKASNNGDDYATAQLGIIAVEANDYSEGIKWIKKAAEQGNEAAKDYLRQHRIFETDDLWPI